MTLPRIHLTLIFAFLGVFSLGTNHLASGNATPRLKTMIAPPHQMSTENPGKLMAYDQCDYIVDGNGEVQCNVYLTNGYGQVIENAIDAAWSPDGSRIAYVGHSGLVVLNLNDWSITSVHSGGTSPAWSPDGTKLAFSYGDPFSSGELFVMNADGSAVVQLTNNVGFRGQPAWSSDGQTIAFDCEVESGNYDICSINAEGTGFIRLTSDPAWDSGATFSPDGSAIALATTRYGYMQIATMNSHGTGISQVGAGVWGFQPAWSSDSTRIAFVQPFVGGCDTGWFRICPDTVFIMNRDGSGVRMIASGNRPTWAGSGNPMAWFSPGECDGLDCTFDGATSWGGTGTLSYDWEFGDGTTGSGLTASHTYAAVGTYNVTLTVTDDTGATSSRTKVTNVDGNRWPTARLTYACTGWRCTFDGTGSLDPDGTIERYTWSFGDGGFASGQTATHSYSAAGPFTATLYVTDNRGRVDSEQQVVNLVANSLPVASFTAVCTELTCAFDGSGSSDSDGVIENYAWTFGDGSASGVIASHTYSRPGSFAVSLTVTDNIGATSVQEKVVTVSRSMHIGDLDGVRTNQKGSWTAFVTVTVHNADHGLVANATVTGSWSNGGSASCTTDASGQCILSRTTIPKKAQSITFTIINATHSLYRYGSVDNHDPDGESNGTNLTIRNQ